MEKPYHIVSKKDTPGVRGWSSQRDRIPGHTPVFVIGRSRPPIPSHRMGNRDRRPGQRDDTPGTWDAG